MRNLRNSKGFTLIELMIVVVIIGILAAIAIPKFSKVSLGAKQAEAYPILKQMCSLANAQHQRTDTWPASADSLSGWQDPNAKYFSFSIASETATATAGGGTAGAVTDLQNETLNCDTGVHTPT